MDYTDLLWRGAFVQNPHGFHFGIIKSIDYDNIILENCAYFTTQGILSYLNCVEYFSTVQLQTTDIAILDAPINSLVITNFKELALVSTEMLGYYNTLFGLK